MSSRRMLAAIATEAHSHGVTVLGHIAMSGCRDAAAAGIDFIEHGWGACAIDLRDANGDVSRDPSSAPVQALFGAWIAANVTVTDTPVSALALTPAELEVPHPAARARYDERMAREGRGVGRTRDDQSRGKPGLSYAFVRAGGRLVVGSDPGGGYRIPGFSNRNSLQLLYEALGFTELEAIRIATVNGATALGIAGRIGSIAAGKEADLIVVAGDPSIRIRDSGKVEMVFSNGVLFDPKVLLAGVKGKFGWQ